MGVPADVRAEVEEELAPVFAALAGTLAQCDRMRTAAEEEAALRVAAASAGAEQAVALARSRSAAVRAEVFESRRREAEAEGVLAAARDEVRRIGLQSRRVASSLVAEVVDTVRRTGTDGP